MLGTALRCHGDAFDVDAFIARTPLDVRTVWRRGLPWRPGAREAAHTSGFAVEVSRATERVAQVADAERFVTGFADELATLVGWPGVERVWLDFLVASRLGADVLGHAETFPATLLAALGALGLDLEVTIVDGPDITAADLLRAAHRKSSDRDTGDHA